MTEFLQDRSLSRIPRRMLADQPQLKQVVELMKEVEIPTESLSDISGGWKKAKDKLLGAKFQKGFKQAAEQSIIGTIGLLGGGQGKVFALGMEIGDIFRRRMTEGDVNLPFCGWSELGCAGDTPSCHCLESSRTCM